MDGETGEEGGREAGGNGQMTVERRVGGEGSSVRISNQSGLDPVWPIPPTTSLLPSSLEESVLEQTSHCSRDTWREGEERGGEGRGGEKGGYGKIARRRR